MEDTEKYKSALEVFKEWSNDDASISDSNFQSFPDWAEKKAKPISQVEQAYNGWVHTAGDGFEDFIKTFGPHFTGIKELRISIEALKLIARGKYINIDNCNPAEAVALCIRTLIRQMDTLVGK